MGGHGITNITYHRERRTVKPFIPSLHLSGKGLEEVKY